MEWLELILSFVTFLVAHSIPLRPAIRKPLENRVGLRTFLTIYSVASLVALVWLIDAANRAPFVPLWAWEPWQLRVPQVAMAAVCLIAALSLGKPNPFSFGGARNADFDPSNPGIVGLFRHPLLVAMLLWAAAHVVPNGDLAHVAMFGAFAMFAVLGMAMIDRRRKRSMGSNWSELRPRMTGASVWAAFRVTPDFGIRVALAAVAYGLLVWAHPLFFGVDPFG